LNFPTTNIIQNSTSLARTLVLKFHLSLNPAHLKGFSTIGSMQANPSMILSFDLNEFFLKIVQYSINFSPYVLIQKHGKRHCGWGDLNLGNKTNKQPSFIDRYLVIIIIA
jgi:hypothetical protein